MHIGLATDHAGFALKEMLAKTLTELGHEVRDFGAKELNPDDDYPDYAANLGRAVARGEVERGVLLCGSGIGASVAANKIAGVRAGLCHDTYSAHQGVEHDNINILVLGARVIGSALAAEILRVFLSAQFQPEERHVRRLKKIQSLE